MLKNKLLLSLILTGCFSGYALAASGPSLNKQLPVSLKQETKLAVDWVSNTSFYPDMMVDGSAFVGKLTISSIGLSSVTMKSTEGGDQSRQGTLTFTGPSGTFLITGSGTPSNGVISKKMAGGITFTPPAASATMPGSFDVSFSPMNSSSSKPAGKYTANIVVESIVA